MALNDLPTELLEKVSGFLGLQDRQALAATCRRMEAVAMQPRLNGSAVLRLNRVTKRRNRFGSWQLESQVLPKAIVEGSWREYSNVRIELYAGQELDEVCALLDLLPQPLKLLDVIDHNCLQVLRLYARHRALFGRVETLHVWQWGSTRPPDFDRALELPVLRALAWHEHQSPDPNSTPTTPDMHIALTAPCLERALFTMTSFWNGVFNVPHLQLTAHPTLRRLSFRLDDTTVERFAQVSHAALEELVLNFPTMQLTPAVWSALARCAPNLHTLVLVPARGAMPTDMILAFLQECAPLRSLFLHGCVLPEDVFVPAAWQRLQHLHVHDGLVALASGPATLALPALETLCLQVDGAYRAHTLTLELPLVRTLSLYVAGRNVTVASAPRLERLRVRLTGPYVYSLLQGPLPQLHTLTLETVGGRYTLAQLLSTTTPSLRHLTVVCRMHHGLDTLLRHVDRDLPQLETLTLAGLQHLAAVHKSTLLAVCRLTQLKALHLERLSVCGRPGQSVRLPAQLTTLTMREVSLPNQPFTAQAHQHFAFVEEGAVGSRLYSCNADQAPRTSERHFTWCCKH